MRTVLRKAELSFVTRLAERITGGAFRYQGTGGDIGHGARYIDGVRQLVWLGERPGARTEAIAYYFGAAMQWVKMSQLEFAPEDAARLKELWVRSVGARGDWVRWELEGRCDAEYRWEDANVLTLRNEAGVEFRAVRRARSAYGDGEWVEVFDTRSTATDYGLFVSRISRADVLAKSVGSGWLMVADQPEWFLTGTNMNRLRDWLGSE